MAAQLLKLIFKLAASAEASEPRYQELNSEPKTFVLKI